jgi:hypothetical protein
MLEMIPEGHPLRGVRLKLDRAEQHLETLNGETDAFFQRDPYFVSYERKPDGSEHVFRVHIREAPPLAFGLLIGDSLQNMRSALDHLVWQLAILSGSNPPYRQTAFPVCETPESFRSKGTRDKVRSLAAEHRARIQGMQPFQVGGAAKDHWLWHLNELSRIDRHRVLHPIGGIQGESTISAQTRDEGGNLTPYPLGKLTQTHMMDMEVSYAPFKDGAQIARFGIAPPKPEMEMNCEFSFIVTFGEDVRIGPHHDLNSILRNILHHIRADVVRPFVDSFGTMA